MREAAIPTPARQIIPGDSIKPAGAEGWGTVTAAVLEAGDIVRLYVDNAPAPGSFLFDSTTPGHACGHDALDVEVQDAATPQTQYAMYRCRRCQNVTRSGHRRHSVRTRGVS